MALHAPDISVVIWKEDASLPAIFNPLYSNTNRLLFKKNFYNQSNYYDHKVAMSKDEWDTKEGTDKSMKTALYVQQYGKRHLSGWSNIKQQKN